MRSYAATAAHQALMRDLKGALAKHANLSAVEMLVVAAQLVGNLLALQDQTRYTAAALMELVGQNVEIGNQAAIEAVLGEVAGRA